MTAYSLESNLLPVSDYLRDARPSDFLYLYDWYEATEGDGPDSDAPTLNRMDRIRAAERLFADYYWEKTNEVHASGQGETRMAFIKDDIGNWDLKTFSNRPGKLLNAYTSVADAALEAAITAAGGGVFSAPDPGEAGRLTDLAHRVATGETYAQPTAGGLDAERLHARTVTRITRERDRLVTKEAVLKEQQAAAAQEDDAKLQKIKDAKAAAEKEKADAQARKTACPTQAHACDAAQLATLDTQIATATATITHLGEEQMAQETANKDAATKRETVLKEQREEAVATIRAALDDHQAIIAVLQEASLPVATPATEAPPTKDILGYLRGVFDVVAG